MSSIIKIAISMPTPEVSKNSVKPKPSLRKKVEYARDCMELPEKKKQAIRFLQEVNIHLNQKDRLDEEEQALLELTKPVIHEYGIPADLMAKDKKKES